MKNRWKRVVGIAMPLAIIITVTLECILLHFQVTKQ